MQKRVVLVGSQMSQMEVQEMLAEWAKQCLAEVKPMGRLLRRYKTEGESMHWHIAGLKKGMGTVEVTYLPSSGSLTVLVHDNRRGNRSGQAYKDLAQELEKHKVDG